MASKRTGSRTYLSSQERRAEIVEAAFRCLQDHGYARLTARKIAASSGISLGHITYNFKDMNEVLVETYRFASKRLFEATQEDLRAAPQDLLEQLKTFLRTGFTPGFLRKDYLRVRIDLWSAAISDEKIAETERALYDRYRAELSGILSRIAVERGHSDPQSAAENVAMLADSIMAMLDGLWLDWERRQDEAAIEHGLTACALLVNAVLRERADTADETAALSRER